MLKFFRIPFATAGDKIAVPDASQPSGSVSYEDGFGPDYELDPLIDPAGKDVPRDESNQLYFDITTAIAELQSFGTPDFITSALNGGAAYSYAKFARVRYTDGNVYTSRKNANTSLPTVAADWFKDDDNADYLTIATTAFEASVADGEAVYWDAPNNRFDEAIADGTSKQNVIGFADVTNGRVFVAGLYTGQLSGLTGNTALYLSDATPGAVTSSPPAQNAIRVGVARSAADMFVGIGAASNAAADTGSVVMFARDTAPVGYLKANGAAVSRVTYAALFSAIGITFGAGDGSTTFNLPDARGEFLRGWDDGRGVDTGRVFGSAQVDAFKSHTHTMANWSSPGNWTGSNTAGGLVLATGAAVQTLATGGTETRPRNIAFLACIKY